MTATVPDTRALLIDGSVATIRPLRPADTEQLSRLHAGLPERDRYLRFFSPALPSGHEDLVRRMASGDAHRMALGAFLGEVLVGVANFEVLADPADAEVALAVDHSRQAHGVGTLLLEHLASAARARGVRRFVAEVLAENGAMTRVFRDAGLSVVFRSEGSTCHVTLLLDSDHPLEDYPLAVEERERVADVASLGAVLRPRSIAVVGAGRRKDSIGNAVLRNILAGGYQGTVQVVNPHADSVEGVTSVSSVDLLSPGIDLAVLCIPADAVPSVADECGRHGVRALLVIAAGLTERPDLSDGLLAAVRRHGMRLVGPNCLGVVNTEAGVSLNATFARGTAPPGRVGVVTQSGGVGIALLEQLATVGLGVSTLVSSGDKYDVSGNDMLLWWRHDEATDVAVLHLESFGNPRKFARLARALAEHTPVLTVRTGTSEAGARAAASHTAAAATPAATRDALFQQAGVIALNTFTELIGATCALSWLPLPAGDRIAIVSNAGGAGVLAADACAANGLTLPTLSGPTLAELRALTPAHAGLANPVDTTAGVSDEVFARCLRAVLDDPAVDAVLAIAAATAVADPIQAITSVLSDAGKPVVVVRAGQLSVVEPLHAAGAGHPSPMFGDPAQAVAALAALCRHARWRRRPAGTVPHLPGIDIAAGRAICDEYLAGHPDGGWLGPSEVNALLAHVGLPVLPSVVVTDRAAAVAAAQRYGGPVAVKAVTTAMVHKSRSGGLALGLRSDDEVEAAFTGMLERFGDDLTGVLVQPMTEAGRELLVGVVGDDTFGPLVVLGLGGVDAELLADRTCRLVPVTDLDAADMLAALRGSSMLFDTDESAVRERDADAVTDVLLRVGRLAELFPEIAEADLNPVIVRDGRCRIPDARIRLRPRQPTDPFLRRLRN